MTLNYKNLDPLLHAPLRLSIVSALVARGKLDFNELKDTTEATKGNLSVQLKKLKEAGYINIIKGFKNNYQHTLVEITEKGLDAFEQYVETIRKYIG